jgi:FkbM family methyltransferase
MPNYQRFVPTILWVLFRRLRYARASIFGRNVLANANISIPWRRDWLVVNIIKQVAVHPPRRIRSDRDGREFWQTLAGDFWTPPGASEHFVRMITIEALSDIYYFAAQTWNRAPIVLDCGANVGMFSRMALNLGAEKVVCFEPSPGTAACLRLTFAREIRDGRLAVIEKALWNKKETLKLQQSCSTNPGAHKVTTEDAPETISVDATTVDCVVKELSLPRVDFIKMDIEGAECFALRGAATTMRKFHPVIGVGTEHGSDVALNNELVIETIRAIESSYRILCTEVHVENSPSQGLVLTPYSLSVY